MLQFFVIIYQQNRDDFNILFLFFSFPVLSLFTVVTWGQGQCTAPSGEYGSCVPNNECVPRGGIPGGPCAEGYGMCCVCMYIIDEIKMFKL